MNIINYLRIKNKGGAYQDSLRSPPDYPQLNNQPNSPLGCVSLVGRQNVFLFCPPNASEMVGNKHMLPTLPNCT